MIKIRTIIYYKGSVDTPHDGVDTMFQALSQNMKNWSTSVDTRPGQVDTRGRSQRILFTGLFSQVDTRCTQVDTRWLSQKACFAVWDRVSTPDHLRSTLETSPRELICQSRTVCRHTSWAGQVDTTKTRVDTLQLRSTLTSSSVDTDPLPESYIPWALVKDLVFLQGSLP
ncbi:hypothetical protein Taro_036817 [Colocasia esculenta]|uniref:Uncharacterized protein n=1 Tax=Colocasia esculenta TaxID=4460 RepID=A0A843WHF2_COLES|nr:hypothetical protein [Colocasia esculenta]